MPFYFCSLHHSECGHTLHSSLPVTLYIRHSVCHSRHLSTELLHAFVIPYIPGSLHLSPTKDITPCITTHVCHSLHYSLTMFTCALIILHIGHSLQSSLTMVTCTLISLHIGHSLQASFTLFTCTLIILHTGHSLYSSLTISLYMLITLRISHSRHSSLTMYIDHSIRWLLPLKQVFKKLCILENIMAETTLIPERLLFLFQDFPAIAFSTNSPWNLLYLVWIRPLVFYQFS